MKSQGSIRCSRTSRHSTHPKRRRPELTVDQLLRIADDHLIEPLAGDGRCRIEQFHTNRNFTVAISLEPLQGRTGTAADLQNSLRVRRQEFGNLSPYIVEVDLWLAV